MRWMKLVTSDTSDEAEMDFRSVLQEAVTFLSDASHLPGQRIFDTRSTVFVNNEGSVDRWIYLNDDESTILTCFAPTMGTDQPIPIIDGVTANTSPISDCLVDMGVDKETGRRSYKAIVPYRSLKLAISLKPIGDIPIYKWDDDTNIYPDHVNATLNAILHRVMMRTGNAEMAKFYGDAALKALSDDQRRNTGGTFTAPQMGFVGSLDSLNTNIPMM